MPSKTYRPSSIEASTGSEPAASATGATRAEAGPAFEGHVDFYGYHAGAGGCFIGGWLSYAWASGGAPRDVVAAFDDIVLDGHQAAAFYRRDDVAGRGIGFLFFLRAPAPVDTVLRSLRVVTEAGPHTIWPTPAARSLGDRRLVAHLLGVIEAGGARGQLGAMRSLVMAGGPSRHSTGIVDVYGFSPAAAGWFFAGWVAQPWPAGPGPDRATASLGEGALEGACLCVRHVRHDVPAPGEGFVAFLPGAAIHAGALAGLSLTVGGWSATLSPVTDTQVLQPPVLTARLDPLLAQVPGTEGDALARLLARQPYRGQDTLADLRTPVHMAIDEAIVAGERGLVLMGWLLAHPGSVQAVRVCCGERSTILDLGRAVRTDRHDVLESHVQHGVADPACGFIAYLADAVQPGARIWLEVEAAGELGYLAIPRPKLEGIAAIRRLLAAADLRFSDTVPAFDGVLGPAVAALNQARLATRPAFEVAFYGAVPASPRWSVIIPLHGRLDYLEYQLALFSAHPGSAAVEFIYVLDDPSQRRVARFLFASALERYNLPFKAVLLDANAGFAPASNVGLAQATGEFVVFLNSDVFPGTPDWLERLTAALEADPSIGVIGPLLLFEDGSVQHQGMVFERLPEFGDLYFGIHAGKGLRPIARSGLQMPLSITGACMLLRRTLADQLGGFDERYVVGDFEDSDLCFRLDALGFRCAIDTGVELIHLERKSQASSALGWRMALTVFNAWQHHRKWAPTIAAQQG